METRGQRVALLPGQHQGPLRSPPTGTRGARVCPHGDQHQGFLMALEKNEGSGNRMPSVPQLTGAQQQLPPFDVLKDKLRHVETARSSNKRPFPRGSTKPQVVRRARGQELRRDLSTEKARDARTSRVALAYTLVGSKKLKFISWLHVSRDPQASFYCSLSVLGPASQDGLGVQRDCGCPSPHFTVQAGGRKGETVSPKWCTFTLRASPGR